LTMTMSVGSDPDVDLHQEPGIDPSLSLYFH
jgi:hypothetical protein